MHVHVLRPNLDLFLLILHGVLRNRLLDLLDNRNKLFATQLHRLDLRHELRLLGFENLGHVHFLFHDVGGVFGHLLVDKLCLWPGHLRDGLHGLNVVNLHWLLCAEIDGHLLEGLPRLDDDLIDGLVHRHPLGLRNLRGEFHRVHLDDLHGVVLRQDQRLLDHFFEIAVLLQCQGRIDILYDGFRHLLHDFSDLDFWHLHDALLVDNMRDLNGLFYVIDDHLRHLLFDDLDLDLWDLPQDFSDFDLRHLDDVLLDFVHLGIFFFVDALDLVLWHVLRHLLKLVRTRNLFHHFVLLDLRHLGDDLSFGDRGNLHVTLLDLDNFFLDVLLDPVRNHLWRLPDELDHVYLGNLHDDLLVEGLRHFDLTLVALVNWLGDLFEHILVLRS
mmetsp:Transcript_71347/g.198080  ORF Transcript_71347/g.198080 Transcript_71347/m.198080 type:complete len:385 (-) Transcript_71347:206-1360(-)